MSRSVKTTLHVLHFLTALTSTSRNTICLITAVRIRGWVGRIEKLYKQPTEFDWLVAVVFSGEHLPQFYVFFDHKHLTSNTYLGA